MERNKSCSIYSTPWSRTVRVYSTPGVDLERNKCYSGVDPRLSNTDIFEEGYDDYFTLINSHPRASEWIQWDFWGLRIYSGQCGLFCALIGWSSLSLTSQTGNGIPVDSIALKSRERLNFNQLWLSIGGILLDAPFNFFGIFQPNLPRILVNQPFF